MCQIDSGERGGGVLKGCPLCTLPHKTFLGYINQIWTPKNIQVIINLFFFIYHFPCVWKGWKQGVKHDKVFPYGIVGKKYSVQRSVAVSLIHHVFLCCHTYVSYE